MSDIRTERVADSAVEEVLDGLTPNVEEFYAQTYGSADAAGDVNAEMFKAPRGGLLALRSDDRLVGMAGWTDLSQLGYGTRERPAPDLTGRIAELRRLFLVKEVRGIGLSTVLDMDRLRAIRDDGQFDWAVGETGHAQERSREIHSRKPYRTIEPFGAFAHEADLGSHYYGVLLNDLREVSA